MEKETVSKKRYNFVIPIRLYDELVKTAKERDMQPIDLLRLLIKLGLFILQELETPGTKLAIKRGDTYQDLLIFD